MMVAVEVDEMSQMSSQLFKGLIQHLMTLQRYTDTVLASHYSNIHVSIPPDPDFGTSQSAMMVAVEVDEKSQISFQLFKGLI